MYNVPLIFQNVRFFQEEDVLSLLDEAEEKKIEEEREVVVGTPGIYDPKTRINDILSRKGIELKPIIENIENAILFRRLSIT